MDVLHQSWFSSNNNVCLKCSSSFPSMQEIDTSERCVCLTRDVQTSLSISMATAVSKVTASNSGQKACCVFDIFSRVEIVAFVKLWLMRTSLVLPFRWRHQLWTPRAKFWCPGFPVTKPQSREPHRGKRKGNQAQTPKRLVGFTWSFRDNAADDAGPYISTRTIWMFLDDALPAHFQCIY